MPWWQGVAVLLGVVAVMEVVAIVAHRWVMHGFLWSWHRSHHEPRTGWFEKNDLFGVIGAIVSMSLFWWGFKADGGPLVVWIAGGITAYGAIYFGFHDVLVHRRVRHSMNPRSRYLKRIMQAHRLHHVVETKHGTVSFGFLYAPPVRTLLAELEARGGGRIRSAQSAASSKVRREMDPAAASAANG